MKLAWKSAEGRGRDRLDRGLSGKEGFRRDRGREGLVKGLKGKGGV